MQREDAIKELNNIPYPSEKVLDSDKEYFLKKMNWTNQELIDYIARPSVSHNFYPSEKKLWDLLIKLYKIF